MSETSIQRNELCYLDTEPGASSSLWDMSRSPMSELSIQQEPVPGVPSSTSVERRWLPVVRSAFALAIVVVLAALGIANIVLYARWHDVEDGVLWGGRAEG